MRGAPISVLQLCMQRTQKELKNTTHIGKAQQNLAFFRLSRHHIIMYRVNVLSKSGAIPALSTFPRCLHTVACEVALHAPDPARTYNRTHTNPISRTDPSEHGEIASVVLADRTRPLPIVAHVFETKPQAHSASGKISRRADFAAACRGLVT